MIAWLSQLRLPEPRVALRRAGVAAVLLSLGLNLLGARWHTHACGDHAPGRCAAHAAHPGCAVWHEHEVNDDHHAHADHEHGSGEASHDGGCELPAEESNRPRPAHHHDDCSVCQALAATAVATPVTGPIGCCSVVTAQPPASVPAVIRRIERGPLSRAPPAERHVSA